MSVGKVVGEVEHAADKCAVAGYDLFHQCLTVAVGRRSLDDEAALRSHGHYHRVLHRLGLHEAQDLGAELLPPIGPTDTAPRDLPTPEMHALGSRRIDEDLEHRAREWEYGDARGIELEREVRLGFPFGGALEVVRAHRRQSHAKE